MRLASPSAGFLTHGKRFTLYLWKWGKLRFIRLPSGAGVYSFVPSETTLAVSLPDGPNLRLALPTDNRQVPYFAGSLRGFTPVGAGELRSALRQAERRTEAVSALSVGDLIRRFGAVPVAPEDGYSSGQCWYGTKAWAEVYFNAPAPTLRALLEELPRLPAIERPAFVASAVYAAAYVVGDNDGLLQGVSEADIAAAVAEGRKADGSGAFRLPRMNAGIHGRRQDGQKITARSGEA